MAEMATIGIAEPAAGNIPGSAIRIEALQETLRHPSGTQGLTPLDRYIRNYDSAYHIIFTNVKTIQQVSPEVTSARHQRAVLLDCGWIAPRPYGVLFALGKARVDDCLAGNQHYPAMDLPALHLLKDFVHLRQGTGRDLTANFSCCRHRQHFPHVLSRAD